MNAASARAGAGTSARNRWPSSETSYGALMPSSVSIEADHR
jgi:hypothetical protein